MKKRLEFVMDSEEYGDVTNIVGSEKKNIEMMAVKLINEDVPKGQIIDFLYNVRTQLDVAHNILRNCE